MTSVSYIKHQVIDRIRIVYLFLKDKRTRDNMLRYLMAKNKKSKYIIKLETKELIKYWGFFPIQYYTHDFYSKSCTLSIEEMKEYIPSYYFYKIIYPHYDDIKKTILVLENKTIMKDMFHGLNIPTSKTILIKRDDCFFDSVNNKLEDAFVELNRCLARNIFIKPTDGRGGKGILIGEKINSHYMCDDSVVDVFFLRDLDGDYIIEEAIEQHDDISDIYELSVNTLRAVTLRRKTSEVELIAVTLRMGINGRKIDNGSAGGILIGIDLSTGMALNKFATYEYGEEKFYHHPDSGFAFSEVRIPNWAIIKNGIIDSAKKINNINLIGWDVAVTNTGFLMIEANTLLGLDHTQSGVGGLRDYFIVGEPLSAIHHDNINEILL